MMTSFCNKKVHPFLSLSNSKDNGTVLDFPLPRGGDTQEPTNYLTSTPMTPPATTATAFEKKDPGGIGFLDEVGGSVDGLMSCTETLGFESSDERSVDDQIEDHHDQDLFSRKSNCTNNNMAASTNSRCWQKINLEKKAKKKFPPPLSSLSQDGKPNFFLRAVRKDGRLELTEVKIGRPETLLASRQDGRLRLHLIHNLEEEEDENEDFPRKTEHDVEVIETNEENIIDDDDEEEKVAEWKFPVTSSGSGDGHRRCYNGHHGHSHNNHHHHHLHVWRQRCVTTR